MEPAAVIFLVIVWGVILSVASITLSKIVNQKKK